MDTCKEIVRNRARTPIQLFEYIPWSSNHCANRGRYYNHLCLLGPPGSRQGPQITFFTPQSGYRPKSQASSMALSQVTQYSNLQVFQFHPATKKKLARSQPFWLSPSLLFRQSHTTLHWLVKNEIPNSWIIIYSNHHQMYPTHINTLDI